jgi:large subunit ribosomal protein L6
MSRIGKLPVALAAGVEVKVDAGVVKVKGPKGALKQLVAPLTSVEVADGKALVHRQSEGKRARAMHGLMRSLLSNMVAGVTEGFERGLTIVGVGYRAAVDGRELTINVGYSHPVVMEIPSDLEVEARSPTELVVRGIDKQRVGQFAAEIRRVRKPEPYKGKGIRYSDEQVRRKVGKAGAAGGAA